MITSIFLLGIAVVIFIIIACSTLADGMMPRPFSSDPESIIRAMEADRLANQAKLFWGIVAVFLCLAATILPK